MDGAVCRQLYHPCPSRHLTSSQWLVEESHKLTEIQKLYRPALSIFVRKEEQSVLSQGWVSGSKQADSNRRNTMEKLTLNIAAAVTLLVWTHISLTLFGVTLPYATQTGRRYTCQFSVACLRTLLRGSAHCGHRTVQRNCRTVPILSAVGTNGSKQDNLSLTFCKVLAKNRLAIRDGVRKFHP